MSHIYELRGGGPLDGQVIPWGELLLRYDSLACGPHIYRWTWDAEDERWFLAYAGANILCEKASIEGAEPAPASSDAIADTDVSAAPPAAPAPDGDDA